MARIEREPEKKPADKQISDLNAGDVFIYAEQDLDAQLENDHPAIYMRVKSFGEPKPGRVHIIALDGKGLLEERDNDRMVIPLSFRMFVDYIK